MLKIFNTLGRELQEFKSIEPGKVRFYQCGPTVYWVQHIGNMRAMVAADLARRTLIYLGNEVDFVRNYTDVGHLTGDNIGDADTGEDRMEKASKREGLSPDEIAQKYITVFEQDVRELNTLEPNVKPRATDYVRQMIEMVEILLDKGFAYPTPSAIYFDTSKMEDYTKLSGQKLEQNKEGAGHGEVDDQEHKKNPADFAIWFFRTGPHANALQYWPSPFKSSKVENGEGFPGWHIECSAMIKQELGDTIDIHMGGIEHIPVHHTNEIAQSESANGHEFVNYWIHNEHLLVNGGKMAKSEGTSYSLADLKEKGFSPLDLRYFFLQAHYRSKQNFTWESLEAAKVAYGRLKAKVGELIGSIDIQTALPEAEDPYKQRFVAAIENDFNTPEALAVTWDVVKSDINPEQKLALILDFDNVLGLQLETAQQDPHEAEVPEEAQELINARAVARADKNWSEADRLRDELKEKFGLTVKDTAEGQLVQS